MQSHCAGWTVPDRQCAIKYSVLRTYSIHMRPFVYDVTLYISHVAFRRRELAWSRVGCDEWTSPFNDPRGLRWLVAYGVAANTFLCLYTPYGVFYGNNINSIRKYGIDKWYVRRSTLAVHVGCFFFFSFVSMRTKRSTRCCYIGLLLYGYRNANKHGDSGVD